MQPAVRSTKGRNTVTRHSCCNAGLVSLTLLDKPLFGPPHMHMQHPTRSHFIGDLSPQGNPLHYLSSVRSLHRWYWSQCDKQQDGPYARPPLVINTHGWIKVCLCILLCTLIGCCAMLCCDSSCDPSWDAPPLSSGCDAASACGGNILKHMYSLSSQITC